MPTGGSHDNFIQVFDITWSLCRRVSHVYISLVNAELAEPKAW